MKASLFFLFNHGGELYIVDNTKIDDVPKPRELIFRASQIEIIRERALHMSQDVVLDTARARTAKHTDEGIERIREAKLGSNHPAVKNGRDAEFREKVSNKFQTYFLTFLRVELHTIVILIFYDCYNIFIFV